MSEKRKFSRIHYSGHCTINEQVDGLTHTLQTEILDISLNGALVTCDDGLSKMIDHDVKLNLQLTDSEIFLQLSGVICHQETNVLGIKFISMPLESITHLKRLVQLNLGDEDLLHREISHLINIESD